MIFCTASTALSSSVMKRVYLVGNHPLELFVAYETEISV